jgi:hypothetical protein
MGSFLMPSQTFIKIEKNVKLIKFLVEIEKNGEKKLAIINAIDNVIKS